MLKKFFRMVIFSGFAVYLTSIVNKGFILPSGLSNIAKFILFIAVLTYIILPVSKIVLLPLQIITFGLVSFFVYLLGIYFAAQSLHIVTIRGWLFNGITSFGISLPKTQIGYVANLVLSSFLLSSIINLLERFL